MPQPQAGPGPFDGQVDLDQARLGVGRGMPGQSDLLQRMKASDHSGGTVSTVIRLPLVTQHRTLTEPGLRPRGLINASQTAPTEAEKTR